MDCTRSCRTAAHRRHHRTLVRQAVGLHPDAQEVFHLEEYQMLMEEFHLHQGLDYQVQQPRHQQQMQLHQHRQWNRLLLQNLDQQYQQYPRWNHHLLQ